MTSSTTTPQTCVVFVNTPRCDGFTGFSAAGGTKERDFPWTSYVRKRGRKAWTTAELEPVTLRQLRHAHRSFLDAAGISDARADRYMGHARHTVARRYTHQLRGQLAADAEQLEGYLTREAGVVVPFPTGASAGAKPSPHG